MKRDMNVDPRVSPRAQEYFQDLLSLLPRGIRHYPPQPPFFTGYEYETIYDWDQYFDAILLAYCGYPADYTRNGLRHFLALQEEDGFVPRSFHPTRGVYFKHNTMFKPFLSQMALLTVHQDGDLSWLANGVFDQLKKFYLCWRSRFDVRGAGLSVWHDAGHTGMDNHDERAGNWQSETGFCEGIDLNAYLVREGEALAVLAGLLGRQDDRVQVSSMVVDHRRSIQQWLWNEKEGFFFDFHARENRPIPVRHVGAFAALWATLASPAQSRRLIEEHLLNSKEFGRPYPLPALAASEPGYSEGFLPGESTRCCNWRANTWIPANYFTFHGLLLNGADEEAGALAQRTFSLFDRGPFSEYYTTESGIGTGLKPFWGWSALAIFMPAEFTTRADPTRLVGRNDSIAQIRRLFAG